MCHIGVEKWQKANIFQIFQRNSARNVLIDVSMATRIRWFNSKANQSKMHFSVSVAPPRDWGYNLILYAVDYLKMLYFYFTNKPRINLTYICPVPMKQLLSI